MAIMHCAVSSLCGDAPQNEMEIGDCSRSAPIHSAAATLPPDAATGSPRRHVRRSARLVFAPRNVGSMRVCSGATTLCPDGSGRG